MGTLAFSGGRSIKALPVGATGRKYSPKNTDRKGDSALLSNHLEARRWTDTNTLLLYAYSEEENGEAAALFTLKFDEAGNWKVVKMHRMSEKELNSEKPYEAFPIVAFAGERLGGYVVFAEPIDSPPSEAILKPRFAALDQELQTLRERQLTDLGDAREEGFRRVHTIVR